MRSNRIVQLLALLILLGAASCGTVTHSVISVRPLNGVTLDTSLAYASGEDPVLLDAGQGSVITVGQDSGRLHIVCYDPDLSKLWQREIALGPNGTLESSGIHIHEGRLFVPVLYSHQDAVLEYRSHSVDVATGEVMTPSTLLRLNRHDIGALPNAFAHDARYQGQHLVRSVWTPDSSKLLLFKQYPTGSGRVSIEMMLYKRGFSLITKNNVDFRLDTSTQQLIGILPDNDGVAYIFLYNLADSSIEVGRFEILGSKKLRTIKYELPSSNGMLGAIAVAPRGHAYLAVTSLHPIALNVQLIDLDFYSDRATGRKLKRAGAASIFSEDLQPPSIMVVPQLDRLLIEHQVKTNLTLTALTLDLEEAWESRSFNASNVTTRRKLVGSSIGYITLVDGTLKLDRTDLTTGQEHATLNLAEVEGISAANFVHAQVLGRYVYVTLDRLYRLTLP